VSPGRIVKLGVLALVAVALLIQLVPYGHGHHNANVVADAPWPDAQSRRLAVAACYDCHSNQTKWPWYSNVAPLSWWVQRHVDAGRRSLNFSEWGTRRQHRSARALQDGRMPPNYYTLIHATARLSKADKAKLAAALEKLDATLPAEREGGGERGGD